MNDEIKKESLVKTIKGVVVSKKMQKTAIVKVERVLRHPKYGKPVKRHKLFKVHDESDSAIEGQIVLIKECAPISKTKHMTLYKTL